TQGWMGLGDPAKVELNDGDDLNNITGANRFFSWQDENILNNPSGETWGAGFTFGWRNGEGLTQIVWGSGEEKWYVRQRNNKNSSWSPWREIYHTGNILKTTENNDNFPMSQKAVTEPITPIGMCYTQYPATETPSTLFGGTWTLMFNTEGVFF